MTLFANNSRELEGIVMVMKKLGNKFRVYRVEYTALEKITFKDGVTDEFESPKIGYLVDDSANDDNIRSKAFDAVVKEFLSNNKEIEVDRENKTIYFGASERFSKHLYDFRCSSELAEATVELLTTDNFKLIK